MVHHKIKQLAAAKADLVEIETYLAVELPNVLLSLPAQFGFDDPRSFTEAVLAAHSGKGGRKKAKAPKAAAAKKANTPKPAAGKKTRTRAVITDETRAQVKKFAEEGKTGAQIAEALKISLPSVQNIKKALGLVKARK